MECVDQINRLPSCSSFQQLSGNVCRSDGEQDI